MEFTYKVNRVNTHEPTLNVEYYPTDTNYTPRIKKIYLMLENAAGLTETEFDDFVRGEIIRQAPYYEWQQELGISALLPILQTQDGRSVTVDAVEVEARRSGPPTVMTLEQAKVQTWARIESWRNMEEMGKTACTYMGYTWDADQASIKRLAPVLRLPELPPGFIWTTQDNQDVPLTQVELQGLETAIDVAIVERGFAIHQRQRQMKEEMSALTEVNAVLAYAVGWPPAPTGV